MTLWFHSYSVLPLNDPIGVFLKSGGHESIGSFQSRLKSVSELLGP